MIDFGWLKFIKLVLASFCFLCVGHLIGNDRTSRRIDWILGLLSVGYVLLLVGEFGVVD
jgi:hypothetical protein